MIRPLTQKDLPALKELLKYSFSLDDAYFRRPPFTELKIDQLIGYFADGHLVACSHTIPFKIYMGGKLIPAGGISWVASDPAHRRKGCMQELMVHSIADMRRNKVPLSILWAAEFFYYHPLGWEQVSEFRRWDFEFKDMFPPRAPSGSFIWLKADRRSAGKLLPIYRKIAEKSNLFVQLDSEQLSLFLQEYEDDKPYIVAYHDTAGELRGYMRWANNQKEKRMEVWELYTLDNETERAFMWFIHNHSAQFKKVRLFSHPDAPYHLYLRNPRVDCYIRPGITLRLVDVAQAFQARPYNKLDKELGFSLRLQDEHAPWNERPIDLLFKDGKCVQTKAEQPQLSTSIQTLAQLYTNFISFHTALDYHLIQFSEDVNIKALDELFALHKPYMFHWF